MTKKSSIWFDGVEYRWNDKYHDYVYENRKFGRLRYRKYQNERKKTFSGPQIVRYAGAKGAKGIQGVKGATGVQGIGGAKKPSIWYKGYEYKWDGEIGDYVHWVDQGNGGIPMKYKEVVAKDIAKTKADVADYEDMDYGLTETFYKGFDKTPESLEKFREYLKHLPNPEDVDKELDEFHHYIAVTHMGESSEGEYAESNFQYVESIGNEIREEQKRREKQKIQDAVDELSESFPTFSYSPVNGHKSLENKEEDLEKFREYLTTLKDEKDLKKEADFLKMETSLTVRGWDASIDDGIPDEAVQIARKTLIKNLLDDEEPFRLAIRDEERIRKEIGACRTQFHDSIVYGNLRLGSKTGERELQTYLQSLPVAESVEQEKEKIARSLANARKEWIAENKDDWDKGEFKRISRAISEESLAMAKKCDAIIQKELDRRRHGGAPITGTRKKKIAKYESDVSTFPKSVSEVKIVNDHLGGSTGAKMVEDGQGNRYVMKTGNSPEHIKSECYADAFYQATGVKVPSFKIYDDNGTPVKLAAELKNATALGEWWNGASQEERDEMRKKLRRGYAADILLGNWDVVGMDADNILIDQDGDPWRIDNGGSMRFRAQGAVKNNESWGKFCDDLFTMTGNGEVVGRKKSSGITKYFGETRPLELAQEINSLDWSESLSVLPDDERRVVLDRLEEIRQIAERGSDAEQFGRTAESTDRMIAFSYQMSRDGIREALPKKVKLEPSNLINWQFESGWLSHDNTTVTINGKDYESFGEYLADKMGADNFNLIQDFNTKQGVGSYDAYPVLRKLCILKTQGLDCLEYENVEDFLHDVEEAGYYSSYAKPDDHKHRQSYVGAFQYYHANPDEFKKNCEAIDQYDAAVQLILENVQLKNVDPVTRTVILGRTEKDKYFQTKDGKIASVKEGDRTYHHTGVCESHSRVQYKCIEGFGLTIIRVPFSRIHGLWMVERGSQTDSGYIPLNDSQFCSSDENEIIADTHGLPIIFVKGLFRDWDGGKREWDAVPYIDSFKQWEKEHPDQVLTVTVTTGARNND